MGETDRELVLIAGPAIAPKTLRYLAIEIGASLTPEGTSIANPAAGMPAADPASPPNEINTSRDAPAGGGEVVVTERVALEVLAAERGGSARSMVAAAGSFNPSSLPENEYVVVRVRVTAVGTAEEPVVVSPFDFSMIGPSNVRFSPTGLISPEPALEGILFSGGTVEGMLAFEVARAERGAVLIYQPGTDDASEPRHLDGLRADAATSVP